MYFHILCSVIVLKATCAERNSRVFPIAKSLAWSAPEMWKANQCNLTDGSETKGS